MARPLKTEILLNMTEKFRSYLTENSPSSLQKPISYCSYGKIMSLRNLCRQTAELLNGTAGGTYNYH